jgi:cysteinyl-tRNA synthetase
MLSMIQTLEARGLAYQAPGGDVNFAVRKFQGYGKLSGKSIDELRAGERVPSTDSKADPLDFVLWKAAKPDEPADAKFASSYGPGRPGWHIECSAMACALLGEQFDLHGGGMDLQFPHHENEIAQSQGAHGVTPAAVWVHNGLLNIDHVKMSKSLGNFFTIREVLQRYDGETVRFFLLRTHYRSPFNFSDVALDDARNSLRRLYTALDGLEIPDVPVDWLAPQAAAFRCAMNDDFNTSLAVAVLFELATELNRTRCLTTAALLKGLANTLNVLQQAPLLYLRLGGVKLDEAYITEQINKRAAAKRAGNFGLADEIRTHLSAQGVVLKDSALETTWMKA